MKKSEANELLSILFWQDGVPPAIICDNAKEMNSFTPQSNAAESEMKELKKGVRRKTKKIRAPKKLGMIACGLNGILDQTLHMPYTNYMGVLPRQL